MRDQDHLTILFFMLIAGYEPIGCRLRFYLRVPRDFHAKSTLPFTAQKSYQRF